MRPVIVFLLFALPPPLAAQIKVQNHSLIKDSNVIYYGVYNYFEISGIPGKTQLAFFRGSRIESQINNHFTVLPAKVNVDTALVYSGKKLMTKKIFKIDTLPPMRVQLGS